LRQAPLAVDPESFHGRQWNLAHGLFFSSLLGTERSSGPRL